MSNETFRCVRWMAVLLGIVFGSAFPAYAETSNVVVTPVETAPTVRTAAELEELVAPIALYPDDLLAVALPAATYPVQIVQAARLLETAQAGSTVTPDEAWDDSVVALMNYPEVVQLMDRDLDWTWKLGDAVLNQQADVLDAVERFRVRAHAAGNLKTDERQVVTVAPEAIQIAPADPKVIYVPYYEPARVVVYQRVPVYHYYPVGYPVYYYPYPFGYTFDSGFFWGVTSVYRLGWHTHHVHVHPYYSHYHPYYGHRYYNHYYRQPWRGRQQWGGGNDNHHQHASYWQKNDHNDNHGGSGWNGNHRNGRDFDRNRDNFDRSDVWRHDRSRGGARQHDRNRFERDGQRQQGMTFANERNRDRSGGTARTDRPENRRDTQRDANRFPLPTDRTAFRSSAPDIRTRQANETAQARSDSDRRRNQQARARSQNQQGQQARAQQSRAQQQRGASAPADVAALRADQPAVRARGTNAPSEAGRDFRRRSFETAQAQRTQRGMQRERERTPSAVARGPAQAAPPSANRQRFENQRRDNRRIAENRQPEARRQNAPQFRSAERSQGQREQSRAAPPQQARPMVAQAPREQRSNDGASRQRVEGRQRDGNRGSERHEARSSSSSESRGRGFSRRHD